MTAEHIALIQEWGYWLMFFAAIIEGETFLILGGIAAAAGMLGLWWIIVLSIIGCIIHDSFFFYLGCYIGPRLLKRKLNWQPKVDRIIRLLEKYDFWLIIAFRFAYGLRTVIPFALGVTKISNLKFFIFDTIGAVIWVCVFVVGGFYFGHALELLLHQLSLMHIVKEYWMISLILLVLLISVVSYIIVHMIKRRNLRKYSQERQIEKIEET